MSDRTLAEEIGKRQPFDRPEQEAALNLARTSDYIQSGLARFFKPHGLTSAQFNVLRILRGEGKRLPCGEISRRMITHVPDVTRLIDRLVKAKLAARVRTPEDRRLVLVEITPEGQSLLKRLDAPILTLHESQLGHLSSDELAELNHLLVKARRTPIDPELVPTKDDE